MGMHEPAAAGGGGGANNKSCFSAGWGLVAKLCDYCNCAAALLFCRTDSAFMCMACDSKLHADNKLGSKHERVWMCEVCEQAPASVTCKADAAALCVTCDRDIHSANPLARRHERSPVVPFYDTAELVVKSTAAATFLVPPPVSSSDHNSSDNVVVMTSSDHDDIKLGTRLVHDSYVNDPWISSMDPLASRVPANAPDLKSMEFFFSDSDNYLDFDYPISSETRFQQHYGSGTDGVVPVQTIKPPIPAQLPSHSTEKHFEIDFTKSQISSYNNSYNPQSLSHSVSSSSLDVGVVPDGSCMSDISYPYGRSMSSNALDLNGSIGGNQGSQMVGMDREARVLRYREKRKNRKFEKTIRYASRKAYAETRPRIKGRFAKRSDQVESDHNIHSTIDRMFNPPSASASASAFFAESRFGVVPSF